METTIEDIVDKEVETLEDEFSGKFCECGHLIENVHFYGFLSKTTKCRALFYNRTMLSNCDCTKIIQYKFEIRIIL